MKIVALGKLFKTLSTHSALVRLDGAQTQSRCWPKLSQRRPSTYGHSHKPHSRPRLSPQNPQESQLLPLSLDTNLKSEPGSFNPELCGGSRRSKP
jgi:hypothetical protein